MDDVLRDIGAIREDAMQRVEREGVPGSTMRDPRAALQAIKLESELIGLFNQAEAPRNPVGELLAQLKGNVIGINPNPLIECDGFGAPRLPDVQ